MSAKPTGDTEAQFMLKTFRAFVGLISEVKRLIDDVAVRRVNDVV
jgi:hypothetical protein